MRYRLRYFTAEQIEAALKVANPQGIGCADPDALRAGAAIEVAAARRAAERETAEDAGPDAA